MNSEFQNYNKTVAAAFNELLRRDELISKKTGNLLRILQDQDIKTVLHYGYGPTAVGLARHGYQVSLADHADVPADEQTLFQHLDNKLTYDAVIAVDEYFTFANGDEQQQDLINSAFDLTGRVLITTVSDYKNMSENHREFSDPQSYKTQNGQVVYLERNIKGNRNNWQTKIHKILESDECITAGPFNRHCLFFKQLARMGDDAGATSFNFQKSMMYKGMLKKSYEHIISINFN